jgi:Tfp pilus assembly protein PilE
MNNRIIKQEKGFAASDALIAILIISLFAGLVAVISYNNYIASSSIKRMSKATGYIVDMFEYIDKTYYDDVTEEKLINYFNNKYYYETNNGTPKKDAEVKIIDIQDTIDDTPFKAELTLINYNQTEGNEDKIDLVKEITMKVTYKLGNKEQNLEMKRIKQREKLETPNRPNLSLIKLEEGEKIYSIKNSEEGWVVCDLRDNAWYNYQNGNWAMAVKTNEDLTVGQHIDLNNLAQNEVKYTWIPRFGYDATNNKLVFLFSNSDKFLDSAEGYNNLEQIDKNVYEIPQDFTSTEEPLEGIWTTETTSQAYQILNSIYPLNK